MYECYTYMYMYTVTDIFSCYKKNYIPFLYDQITRSRLAAILFSSRPVSKLYMFI